MKTREEWEQLARCYISNGTVTALEREKYISQVVEYLLAHDGEPRNCLFHACAAVSGIVCHCTPCSLERGA